MEDGVKSTRLRQVHNTRSEKPKVRNGNHRVYTCCIHTYTPCPAIILQRAQAKSVHPTWAESTPTDNTQRRGRRRHQGSMREGARGSRADWF